MPRKWLTVLCAWALGLALIGPVLPAAAQSVFPLPAPLYILTSNSAVILVDPLTGGQTMISSDQMPVADFDIAPDGSWWAYRSPVNNAVIVETLNGFGGYVLEFSDATPPAASARQSIAWSPNAAHLAYLVPGGARIADLGLGEAGESVFTTLSGEWVEVYWDGPSTVIALDASDNGWRIALQDGTWNAAPLGSNVQRYTPPVNSTLTPEGVQVNGVLVPGTAGAQAYDWGPVSEPVAFGAAMTLPADVYYIAPDVAGIEQLWRAPASGAAPLALTPAPPLQFAYAPSPDGQRVAIYGSGQVAVLDSSGGSRQVLATISAPQNDLAQGVGGGLGWSVDGSMLAYTDPLGLWVVPADGSAAAWMLLAHTLPGDAADGFSIRVYGNPVWSPDGTRLAISIGLYEGGYLGVVDVVGPGEAAAVIELPGAVAYEGWWTDDGRVLTWAAGYGYVQPGIYALDPNQPDAAPQSLLEKGMGVVNMIRQERPGQNPRWIMLVTSTPAYGPQYVYPLAAESLDGPFVPVYGPEAGGFVEHARLYAAPDGTLYALGLRNAGYNEYGQPTGQPVILTLETGAVQSLYTSGPAHDLRWGY